MMETLIGLGLKSLMIAGLTLVLLVVTRRRSAADRSSIAHLGLFALFALPLASVALPALTIEAPAALAVDTPTALPMAIAPVPVDTLTVSAAPALAEARAVDWMPYAYAVPVIALLLVTLVALLRLFALRTRAQVLADPVWLGALAHAQRRMGFKSGTALLTSRELNSPISWGLMRPVILLNEDAVAATDEAEAIIAHELAHVARFDWVKLMLARVATAMFWFNPFAWLLAREAHQLREEAADDAVLASNIADTDYAQLLVGVARHQCRGRLLGAHGISPGKGSLRRRVRRVLDVSVARGAGGRSWVAGFAAGMLVMSAPLAALSFAPQPPAAPQPPRLAPAAPHAPLAPPAPPAPLTARAPVAPVAPIEPVVAIVPVPPAPPAEPAPPVPPAPPAAPLEAAIAETVSSALKSSMAASGEMTRALAHADRALRTAERARRAYRRHPANLSTEMRMLGVTPEYIAAVRAAAPQFRSLADRELIVLRVKGVSPAYIRALGATGYGHESPEAIGNAAMLGVNADTIREYSRVAPRRSLADLAELRMMGVTPDFIAASQRAGRSPLTKQQLIELRLIGARAAARRTSP